MATHASPKDLLTLANALDGTDSFPIAGMAQLSGGLKLDADPSAPISKCDVVTVTAAQLRTLAASPVTLVAAAAGKFYVFKGAVIQYRGGSNVYNSVGAGEDLAIRYTDGSGAIVSATLDTTTDINFGSVTDDESYMPALATVVAPVTNSPLVLDNVGAGELASADAAANGDGIITVTILYDVYTAIA